MKDLINLIMCFVNKIFYSNKKSLLRYLLYFFIKGFIRFSQNNVFFTKILQKTYKCFFDFPKLLYIHPHKACNLKCIYCYEKGKKIKENLSFNDYIRIFEQAEKLGISSVHILGGEPFLYKNIFKMMDFLNKKDFSVHIYTNGSILNKNLIKRLTKYKNLSILFSLEPKEVYKKICGKDFFNKVIENYNECNKNNISTGILFTLNKINFPYIESFFANTISKYNMNLISERFLPVGNLKIDNACEISSKEWNVFLKILKKYNKKNYFIPFSDITPVFRGFGCNDFYESIHINSDGYVSPCEYVMNKIKIGNIRNNSLEIIWNKYKMYRLKWLKKSVECHNCKFANFCGGGCKAYCFLKTGKFDIKDPLCNLKQTPFA
ncbi:MAG: radical SAM protein [Candidatus Muirbacterium halophilum]|nr:radical SAM protein [Candidatus Muirbacterium halophilum]